MKKTYIYFIKNQQKSFIKKNFLLKFIFINFWFSRATFFTKSFTILTNFLNYSQKYGLKSKFFLAFSLFLSSFYNFFFFNIKPTEKITIFNELGLLKIIKNPSFLHFLNILEDVLNLLSPSFNLTSKILINKTKNKKQKKFFYQITYLKKNQRWKWAFKILLNLNLFTSNLKMTQKLTLTFLDFFINFKQSFLYKNKLNMYKKIFLIK